MKLLKKYYLNHFLFGCSLLTLGVLSVWWIIFFRNSLQIEKELEITRLRHSALQATQEFKNPKVKLSIEAPIIFTRNQVKLELLKTSQKQPGDLFVALPNQPNLGIRPAPDLLEAIEKRGSRRQVMLIGESSLLLLLIVVFTIMLYRMVISEGRHLSRMETFISTITHEMKTPITGIKTLFQTMIAGHIPESQKLGFYQMGLKETARLQHTVENILISGRLRTEAYQLLNQSLALRQFLDELLTHRILPEDHTKPHKFLWEPDEKDIHVICDADALRVLLDNLLDNAMKYGGDTPPTIRVLRNSSQIEINVEDKGIGFTPTQAEELFVPFGHSPNLNTGLQHGTGLGLSIARTLAERMGGSLRAFSKGSGEGSCFTVSLKEET